MKDKVKIIIESMIGILAISYIFAFWYKGWIWLLWSKIGEWSILIAALITSLGIFILPFVIYDVISKIRKKTNFYHSENRMQKMKLATGYWKNADGSIKVTIKVVDKGDFPTANIFGLRAPADEDWSLAEDIRDSVSKTLPTPDEAKQWALAQINALKEKLNNWRNIWVPEPEEFEI